MAECEFRGIVFGEVERAVRVERGLVMMAVKGIVEFLRSGAGGRIARNG